MSATLIWFEVWGSGVVGSGHRKFRFHLDKFPILKKIDFSRQKIPMALFSNQLKKCRICKQRCEHIDIISRCLSGFYFWNQPKSVSISMVLSSIHKFYLWQHHMNLRCFKMWVCTLNNNHYFLFTLRAGKV